MKINITIKILFALIFSALIPLVIYYLVAKHDLANAVYENADNSLLAKSEKIISTTDSWISTSNKILGFVSQYPEVKSMHPAVAKQKLVDLAANYPWFSAIFLTGKDGLQIVRADNGKLSNIAERDYFKAALKNTQEYGSDEYKKALAYQVSISKATGRSTLLTGAPVKDIVKVDGKMVENILGVLGIGIDIEIISKTIATEKIGLTGRAFLIDDKGQLIAHPDSEKMKAAISGKGENFLNHPALLKQNIVKKTVSGENLYQYLYNGEIWRGTSVKTPLGWTLVVEIQNNEIIAPLADLNKNALSVLGFGIVFAFIIALIMANIISSPVKKLTKATEKIANGDFASRDIEEISSSDEIGDLAKSVKRLSASVQIAMDMADNKN